MKKYENFDLTYVTIDSVSEGVGSSQITPLISRLSKSGLKINLISYEKKNPGNELVDYFASIGVNWNIRDFGVSGLIGGVGRLNSLRLQIPRSNLIHARSDIPAVSGIYSNQGPVLWDVRSLWADQKVTIQNSFINLALRAVVPTAVDLHRFKLNPNMPVETRALFSGTYNQYYDLNLSARFMKEFWKLIPGETHWARPVESNRSQIDVGESKVFMSSQSGMAELIPEYSFGISICKLDAGLSLSAAMPTKIAEFLACGRPIVVNKGLGDMDKFISEFDAGVILDGTSTNLRDGAVKLVSLLTDGNTPIRCRALAEKYFSMDVGVSNYLELYSQILKSKT